MNLPENYTIEHRNVKHARLRVHEDGSVQLFVPKDFTDDTILKILESKQQWIASKKQYFASKGRMKSFCWAIAMLITTLPAIGTKLLSIMRVKPSRHAGIYWIRLCRRNG